MPINVFLTNSVQAEAQTLLALHVNLDVGQESISREDLLARVATAEVIFSKTDNLRIDAQVMAAAPRLGMIARHGSGYNNIDMDYANAHGIVVTRTPGVNAVGIAEYTFALMLALARNIVPAVEKTRLGAPERTQFMGMELCGKTLGIIGVGGIGKEVVKRAAAFGMKVLAYHPRPSASALATLPLTLVDLPVLLAESDIISIHAPLSEDTKNLLTLPRFRLMRPQVLLLNLGRGGIVHEEDLLIALDKGLVAGYATDVLAHEPARATDPLVHHPRALVLPHIAAMTRETQRAVAMTAVEDILRFATGQTPLHVVTPSALNN